jgi:hypothetical protein
MSLQKDARALTPAQPAIPAPRAAADGAEPGPPAAPELRPVYGRSGAVAIVACGLVAVVAQFVLPLVAAPVRRTASSFALAGAVGDEPRLVLVVLIALASVGVVVVGGWMLACGASIGARRRGAIAVAVLAVMAIISGLVVLGSVAGVPDDSGTGSPLGPDAGPDAGSRLALAGLLGAVVGALVEVITAGAATSRNARLGHGVGYALLAGLFVATSVLVAAEGPPWSSGVWSSTPEITTSATCMSRPSTEQDGTRTDFDPNNVVDDHHDTAWRCDGDGVGQRLHIDFGYVRTISMITIIPGYAKTDPTNETDRYAQNRRISDIRVEFDDGTPVEPKLDTNPQNPSLQAIPVPRV